MQQPQEAQMELAATKATQPKWDVKEDNRPSDYIYALLSNHVYQNLHEEDTLPQDEDWEVVMTKPGTSGYFGALYYNRKDNHYVLAHRGTANLAGWIEDFRGIFFSDISPQKHEAFVFVKEAVERAKKDKAGLSFTGHSLGAFLAELSVFYCHNNFDFTHVNAVTFESPGSEDRLLQMMPQISGEKLDLTQLDIIGYLSYANLINTCNGRLGTNYQLDPDLGKLGWVNGIFTARAHSMDGLVATFQGQDRAPKAIYLKDWPKGNQKAVFFTNAKFEDGHYQTLSTEDVSRLFALTYEGHYAFDENLSKKNVLPIRNFSPSLQVFLLSFQQWREDIKDKGGEQALQDRLKDIKPEVKGYLLDYRLVKRLNRSDSAMVVRLDTDTEIAEFRRSLSDWLSRTKNRDAMTALMRQPAVGKESPLEIISQILAPGAQVGSLQNVKAIGTRIVVPEDTKPENVAYIKDILQQLQTGGGRIVSQILAEGARANSITGATTIGLELVAEQRNGSQGAGNSTPYFDLEKRRRTQSKEITDETMGETQRMTAGGTSGGGK